MGLATSQVLNSHRGLVATGLKSAAIDESHISSISPSAQQSLSSPTHPMLSLQVLLSTHSPPTVSPLHQFSPFTRAFPSASKHSVSFILKNKQTSLLWVLFKLPPYFSGPLCRKIPKRIVYTRCLQFSPLIISLEPTLTILSASPLQKPPLLKVPSHSSSLMDCPCLPGSTL